jgi:hypothetical protein
MSNLIEIIQIYNFVKERPHLNKLRNSEKILELLKEFHVDGLSTFTVNNNGELSCSLKRNERCTIRLSQAPEFEDRDSIVKWLYSYIRSSSI